MIPLAQSATEDGYGGQAVQSFLDRSLPLTGPLVDILIVVGGGLLLFVIGLAIVLYERKGP